MTINNLTEQWKKGELEQGWYYVKNEFGSIFVSEYSKGYDHINERIEKDFFTEVSDITEVLAPVPSFEQWQNQKECLWGVMEANKILSRKYNNIKVNGNYPDKISKLKSRIKGLLEENQKLKELLMDFVKRMEHYKEVKPDVGFIMFDLGYLANQVKEVLK